MAFFVVGEVLVGRFFFDLELFSNVLLAMFSNKRDEFCVMCSLDPLDLLRDVK